MAAITLSGGHWAPTHFPATFWKAMGNTRAEPSSHRSLAFLDIIKWKRLGYNFSLLPY
jgi:hypothetical protein